MKGLEAFKAAIAERRAVKVIAGIANFDVENVLAVARTAEAAGAHAVDVAARPEIIKAVRGVTSASIVASSVSPVELAEAVAAGADAVELGNFDALYDQGLFLSADDVLKLAEETVTLVAGKALVCITIPGHLTPESQAQLVQKLETLGVDLIQTEGAARVLAAEPVVKSLSQEEKEVLTLRNTKVLVNATRLPVMTASGLTADNVAKAFEAGAAAVGIGSYINKVASEADMIQRAKAVMESLPLPLVQAKAC
ncbi:MAG TPA: DUF561 domain-containing protein [Oculatellaceae cyanobacterium]